MYEMVRKIIQNLEIKQKMTIWAVNERQVWAFSNKLTERSVDSLENVILFTKWTKVQLFYNPVKLVRWDEFLFCSLVH